MKEVKVSHGCFWDNEKYKKFDTVYNKLEISVNNFVNYIWAHVYMQNCLYMSVCTCMSVWEIRRETTHRHKVTQRERETKRERENGWIFFHIFVRRQHIVRKICISTIWFQELNTNHETHSFTHWDIFLVLFLYFNGPHSIFIVLHKVFTAMTILHELPEVIYHITNEGHEETHEKYELVRLKFTY